MGSGSTTLDAAREVERRCAKLDVDRIRGVWKEAQEAEKRFWLSFTPERLKLPTRQWKDFANFLHAAATRLGVLEEGDSVLQVGTAVLDAIYFLPGAKRFSVDPLTSFYREHLSWAYETAMEVIALEGTGERLPFDDHTFSFVILNNMLDHTFEPATVLREAHRVLLERGLLFVGVNVFPPEQCERLRSVERNDPCHPFVFCKDDVLDLLRATNLHPVALKLHPPSMLGGPDERYLALFATPRPRPDLMVEIPGGGWELPVHP
jgi:SAM-dependent methyltransferase